MTQSFETQINHFEDLSKQSAQAVVIACGLDSSGSVITNDSYELVDHASGGVLSQMIESGLVDGEKGMLQTCPLPKESNLGLAVIVGLGNQPKRDDVYRAFGSAVRKLTDREYASVVVAAKQAVDPALYDSIVTGAIAALDHQGLHRRDSDFKFPQALSFDLPQADIDRGRIIGASIRLAKELVNQPPNVIYPESFADRGIEMAAQCGLDAEAWDKQKLEDEGCRAILAVGQGSDFDPRLLIMHHRGGKPDQAPLAIVGKGVTFDSGGLSIKPSAGMVDMKCDMAGAATVMAVMRAVALLKLPINVVGLCGLAENMVSSNSYRLGDVIKTRSGKTIEILNTDAEGRVVLADTLDVAVEMKPDSIIDMATLTGACVVALGTEVVGSMSRHDELVEEVHAAAHHEGEPIWRLPMFELYDEQVQSKVADIRNIGEGRWGGAITAAKFLQNFVGDVPWVHLDIAGPAFADSPKPYRDAGATGVMVRTMIRWVESRISS
ncbi:MAG: leucyl aminopeptidase [Planctomycetota bacterium]